MSAASQYWRWVRINAAGERLVEDIAEAKAFMQAQFPALLDPTDDAADLPNAEVQRSLFSLMQTKDDQQIAECCLRCFISHRIDWVCRDLAQKFGQAGQFNHFDLLPLVLDDTEVLRRRNPSNPTHYQSVASEILQKFNPQRSQLGTWTNRLVISNPNLNAFLQEHGIYLESHWALLNSATPQFLQRRLTLALAEIQAAHALLASYHAVYLRDRRRSSQSRGTKCLPPSPAQLNEMAEILQAQTGKTYSPDAILEALYELAQQIRQALHPPIESTDAEENYEKIHEQAATEPEDSEHQDQFLRRYRHQFKIVLTEVIGQTVSHRFKYLQKKDAAKAQNFLKALFLFHCQAIHMTEIGKQLQLQQYQLSRLMELLKLREDVKRNSVVALRQQIRELASNYVTLAQLEKLMDEIDKALEEEVDRVIEAARTEASTPNRSDDVESRSLFSTLLCRYLDECPYFDHRN